MHTLDAVHCATRALVQRAGGVEAAVAIIGARVGAMPSKGTLSKKLSGSLDWTLSDMIALEDGLGTFAITTLLVSRMSKDDVAPGCLLQEGAVVAREAGEAVSAVLRAQQSAEVSDVALAVVEIDEAIAALQKLRATVAAQGDV